MTERVGRGAAVFVGMPGAVAMIVCLFLPQTRDCHGHVDTAVSSGWAPWMVVAAAIGALPFLWRWQAVRRVAPTATTFLAVLVLGQTLIGIPIAIYLACRYTRNNPVEREALTAASGLACLAVFVAMFPVLSTLIDRHWLVGGYLAWGAAWVEMLGLLVWWLDARAWLRRNDAPVPAVGIHAGA